MGILNSARGMATAGLMAGLNGAGHLASYRGAGSALAGAGVGALYGGTLGRDPGQSAFGGAFSGALGGAAMGGFAGRYGSGMASRFNRGIMMGGGRSTSGAQRLGLGLRGAGTSAFRQMRSDARMAARHIGPGLTKGYNKVRSTLGG